MYKPKADQMQLWPAFESTIRGAFRCYGRVAGVVLAAVVAGREL